MITTITNIVSDRGQLVERRRTTCYLYMKNNIKTCQSLFVVYDWLFRVFWFVLG